MIGNFIPSSDTYTHTIIGLNVLSNPDLLIEIYKQNHTIGIDTWSQPYLTTLTNDEIVSEIIVTAKLIRDILGVIPILIRPPRIFFLKSF